MISHFKKLFSFSSTPLILITVLILGACAHPITFSSKTTDNVVPTNIASLRPQNVAYVMTDADRNKQVITPGGGGDKISYYPYRDLEKMIRDTLKSIYKDVYAIQSSTDNKAMQENNVVLVFKPEIITTSSSQSIVTWPPTQFGIDFTSGVSDVSGTEITRIKATGSGTAEFSEFKSDFGLAARRASEDLSKNLKQAIVENPALR